MRIGNPLACGNPAFSVRREIRRLRVQQRHVGLLIPGDDVYFRRIQIISPSKGDPGIGLHHVRVGDDEPPVGICRVLDKKARTGKPARRGDVHDVMVKRGFQLRNRPSPGCRRRPGRRRQPASRGRRRRGCRCIGGCRRRRRDGQRGRRRRRNQRIRRRRNRRWRWRGNRRIRRNQSIRRNRNRRRRTPQRRDSSVQVGRRGSDHDHRHRISLSQGNDGSRQIRRIISAPATGAPDAYRQEHNDCHASKHQNRPAP